MSVIVGIRRIAGGLGGTFQPVQAQDLLGSTTSQHAPLQWTAEEEAKKQSSPTNSIRPLLLPTVNHLSCLLPSCLKLFSTAHFISSFCSRSAQNLV